MFRFNTICDGYTEHAEFDGDWIVYRPFTRFERTAIGRFLDPLPDSLGERIERRLVASRIVYAAWGAGIDAFDEPDFQELRWLTFGVGRTQQELDDETNLFRGALLLARHPHFARFTCEQCRVWHFDPETFTPIRRHWSEPLRKKAAGDAVQCEVAECPRGHWRDPVEFSEKNRMAWRHYQAFRAALPPDPIVMRNARIIRRAEELADAEMGKPDDLPRARPATAGRR